MSAQDVETFPADPGEILANNDRHRRFDVGNADLWTADELAALPGLPQPQIPVLFPPDWSPSRRIAQVEYSLRFWRRDPLAAKVLERMNDRGVRVVVAGGAAAAPYYEEAVAAGDTDYFPVGLDPSDDDQRWRLVFDFVKAFRISCRREGGGKLIQMLTPGVLSLFPASDPPEFSGTAKKHQLILRAFPSGGAVVHAFDIPSCCTFYDGRVARSTTLGAFAHMHRINLVNPAYRSTTYEKRLVKYFKRHYALGFVDLAADTLQPGQELRLTHLVVTPLQVKRAVGANWAIGDVKVRPASGRKASSDYGPALADLDFWGWVSCEILENVLNLKNLAQLAAGGNRFVTISRPLFEPGRRRAPAFRNLRRPPSFIDVLPRAAFDHTIDQVVQKAFNPRTGHIRAGSLSRYLGMTIPEITRFVGNLLHLIAQNPSRQISVANVLQPFRERQALRYRAAASRPVEWWIEVDPGRQLTASLNPCKETVAEWYGSANVFAGGGPGARGEEEDTCPFCLAPQPPPAPPDVTLPCGHACHARPVQKSGCPCCQGFVGKDTEADERLPSNLTIVWS